MRRLRHLIVTCLLAGCAAGLLSGGRASAATSSGFAVVKNPKVASGGHLVGVTALSASNVWAVGEAGSKTLAEHWTGSAWKVVATPSEPTSILTAVSAGSGSVWAVGHSTGSTEVGLVERWTGSAWVLITNPSNVAAYLSVRVISASNVWAGGYDTSDRRILEHWDGANWTQATDSEPDAISDQFAGLAGVSGHVFAVGRGSTVSGPDSWFERQTNGWANIALFDNGTTLNGVASSSATNAWAVGTYQPQGSVGSPAAVRWNGSSTTEIDPPGYTTSHWLNAVATTSLTNVWAVGDRGTSAGSRTLIDHYTSSGWTDLGGPNSGTGNNALFAITTVPGSSQMWAVGSGSKQPLILRHS